MFADFVEFKVVIVVLGRLHYVIRYIVLLFVDVRLLAIAIITVCSAQCM